MSSLLTGLQAYYKLDESSGNASDSSGNGFTLTNTGSTTYGTGKINNGAQFDGSNRRLASGSNLNFNWSNDYSWSFWVNYNANNTYLLDHVTTSGSSRRAIVYIDNGNKFRIFASGNEAVSASTFTTSTWYHVVSVKSGSNWTLYVNNTSEATTTSFTISYTANDMSIGAAYDGFGVNANATIDEVGFWNKALTTTEISTLYNSGAGLSYPFAGPNTNPAFLLNFL
jgi:hypothetical protein